MSISQSTDNTPIFNNEFQILKKLGSGSTANVYHARSIIEPTKEVALKIIKNKWIEETKDALTTIQKEILVTQALGNHENLVITHGSGNNGFVYKNGDMTHNNLTYLIMENVKGGQLFDFAEERGAMGEDVGRFFMA